MAYVYKHIRLDNNEIFYIGIAKMYRRLNEKRHRSNFWHNIVKNYGYKSEIIIDNISWEHACYTEKYLIKFYGRRDLGLGSLVNLTDGGDGMRNISKEIQIKRVSNTNYNDPKRLQRIINNMPWDKVNTPEAHIKKALKCKKPIFQYDIEGNFIKEWPSAKDIEKYLNFLATNVGRCCKGKIFSSNGYIWRYKDPTRWIDPLYRKKYTRKK